MVLLPRIRWRRGDRRALRCLESALRAADIRLAGQLDLFTRLEGRDSPAEERLPALTVRLPRLTLPFMLAAALACYLTVVVGAAAFTGKVCTPPSAHLSAAASQPAPHVPIGAVRCHAAARP